ncbi:MAG: hypothetical protein ACP5M9_04145 [Candidatus Micrarchaeia archaeon]
MKIDGDFKKDSESGSTSANEKTSNSNAVKADKAEKNGHTVSKSQSQNQRRPFDYSVKLPEGATERQKELAKQIEEERKRKAQIIFDIKKFKRRLLYKLAEQDATKKLSEVAKHNTKNIGYLRRKKERLEFRISTEAYTLDAERDLIRKKNEIDKELQEAIKSYRARRKAEFITSDIAELNKSIDEANKSLIDIEKKLDDLYNELRKLTGQQRKPSVIHKKEKIVEQKPMEVSFGDIAIIKGKSKQEDNDYDGA